MTTQFALGFRYGRDVARTFDSILREAMRRWHCRALNHDGAQAIDVYVPGRRMCTRCYDTIEAVKR